jgi:phosphoglycerate dehydrogenase-like enzyme
MTADPHNDRPRVLVTFSPSQDVRGAIENALGELAEIRYLPEIEDEQRAAALASADAVLAWQPSRELKGPDEIELLSSAGLFQSMAAGVDEVPFDRLPTEMAVASNAGAYGHPIAEHVLGLALALAKRLPQNDAAMASGEFDRQTPTQMIRGSAVGILGFGAVGQSSGRLFRTLGARIHAVNRSGATAEPVEWVGTLAELDAVLAAVDILVVSLPLTHATRGLIAERELSLMKPHAILINVARGAIVDEDPLYEHLRANPSFSAGIDVWWQEPAPHESFKTRRPFSELANVLGSPHNSANTGDSLAVAGRIAAENVARFLRGEPPLHLVDRSEYVQQAGSSSPRG